VESGGGVGRGFRAAQCLRLSAPGVENRGPMTSSHIARQMWTRFEPLHAVTYFTPEARAAYEAVGLRGYWRGYFAGRFAPMGAVDATPVISAAFGFAPRMVTRAVPDVWTRAT